MVRPEGFEPPTLGSEDRCSIQLSYGRTMLRRGTAYYASFVARSKQMGTSALEGALRALPIEITDRSEPSWERCQIRQLKDAVPIDPLVPSTRIQIFHSSSCR